MNKEELISLYAIDWQNSEAPWVYWEHVHKEGLAMGMPFLGLASHPNWHDSDIIYRRKKDAPVFNEASAVASQEPSLRLLAASIDELKAELECIFREDMQEGAIIHSKLNLVIQIFNTLSEWVGGTAIEEMEDRDFEDFWVKGEKTFYPH